MKWLGLLLLLGVCTGAGLRAGCKLHTRARSLTELSRMTDTLAERIRVTALPLHTLLASVIPSPLSARLHCTDDPRGALLNTLASGASAWALTADDCRAIREFIEGFGASDKEGEVRRCMQYAAQFRTMGDTAATEAARRGRLYMTLGICGGGLLALLMI